MISDTRSAPLQALHEDGFVLLPAVLAACTPHQHRLPGDHEPSEYD